jgi:hypothetical protein
MARAEEEGPTRSDVEEHAELEALAYERFKEQILAFASINEEENEIDPFLFKQNNLRPQRFGGVNTLKTFKTYRPIIINSVITRNFNVIPFGYNGPL